MTHSDIQIIVLCEDRQQEVFARYFLVKRGFNSRKIRPLPLPKGTQSGEQYVRERYPKEVKAYRSQKNHLSIALVVLIDADKYTIAERLNQLDLALEVDSQDKRKIDEKIAIFLPRRNIETWIHYLEGETVDEETAYSKLPKESDGKPCIENLANQCQRGLDENAPSSLHLACSEWQKIMPPN